MCGWKGMGMDGGGGVERECRQEQRERQEGEREERVGGGRREGREK